MYGGRMNNHISSLVVEAQSVQKCIKLCSVDYSNWLRAVFLSLCLFTMFCFFIIICYIASVARKSICRAKSHTTAVGKGYLGDLWCKKCLTFWNF